MCSPKGDHIIGTDKKSAQRGSTPRSRILNVFAGSCGEDVDPAVDRQDKSYLSSTCRQIASHICSLRFTPQGSDESKENQQSLRAFGRGPKPRGSDNDSSSTESGSTDDQDRSSDTEKVIIYARVSSDKQAEEGHSLDDQVERANKEIRDRDLEPVSDPIIDEGETGTDFLRDGIKEVLRKAQADDVAYLYVNSIDRLGRATPETLYLIYRLRTDFDVRILKQDGELDITKRTDLIMGVIEALASDIKNQERAKRSSRGLVSSFEDGNWKAFFQNPPLGYTWDGDWITPDEEQISVVRDLFDQFLDCRQYKSTHEYLEHEYAERSDIDLTYERVKSALSNRVYIGEPTVNTENIESEEDSVTIEDESLSIIDEEKFEKAQDVVDEVSREHSTDSDTLDPESAVERFSLTSVLEVSADLRLVCEECDSVLQKNGQRTLGDETIVHNWKCPEGCQQKKWPTNQQYRQLQESSEEGAA